MIKKYPNLESKDKTQLFNSDYLDKAIADQATHRDAISRAHPGLTGTKHLQEKARLSEKGEVKNAEPGSFERMYSLIYRQLSPVAHLNIDGLQAFIGQDKYGKILFHDGDDEDFIATQAVEISLAFCKDLYDNQVILGKQTQTIKEVEALVLEMDHRFRGVSK